MAAKPKDIVFDDLAEPRLTFLQKLVARSAKKGAQTFTKDAVFDAAMAATGLDDFGPRPIDEALEVLLDEYRTDPDISGIGEQQVFNDLVRCASNHLIIHDRIKKTPELESTKLVRPLSVSGLPRSGTTHLVNLLAADSRFRSLPLWVAQEPFHAPGKETAGWKDKFGPRILTRLLKSGDSLTHTDPRYLRCSARWSGMQIMAPDLAAMHPMNPDHIHEELELMTFDFGSNQFEWTSVMPKYQAYYHSKDQTSHYEYMATVLKLLQLEEPGDKGWVLKCVQNPEQLPALKSVMPDATAIFTHRDPVAVIQSTATMLSYGHRMLRTRVNPRAVLDYWTDRFEKLLSALVRDRKLWPKSQSLDVMFHEFMADDMATVRKIYDLHGMEFTPKAEQEIAAFIKAHPRGMHGRVRYHLEEHFGARPEEIRERFDFYFKAFPIKPEV